MPRTGTGTLPQAGATWPRGQYLQGHPRDAPGPDCETKPAAHQLQASTAGAEAHLVLLHPGGRRAGTVCPSRSQGVSDLGAPGHRRHAGQMRRLLATSVTWGLQSLWGAVRPPGLRLRGTVCYSRTGGSTVPPLCKYKVIIEVGGPAGLGSPCPFGPALFRAHWGEAPPGPEQWIRLPCPAQPPPLGGTCRCRLPLLPLLRAERICRLRSLPAGEGGRRDTQGLSGADTAFQPSPWPVTLAGAGLGAPGFWPKGGLRTMRSGLGGGVSKPHSLSLSDLCTWHAPVGTGVPGCV